MSIEAMTACWGAGFPVRADGLSPATVRVVALAVADVVNDAHGNRFYAARRHLARKVGCDVDTISDVMRHLVRAGVVEVVDKSPGRPVEYRWLLGTSGESPHPRRSSTAGGAVTSPPHKPKRHAKKPAPPSVDGRRDYDHVPLTPEQIAEKYGVEL